MSTRPADAGSIKSGSFIVIDGEPCRVVEVEKSKTGKHGSAKARIVGIGIFDGVKRSLIVPTSSRVEVPVVRKFSGQVSITSRYSSNNELRRLFDARVTISRRRRIKI